MYTAALDKLMSALSRGAAVLTVNSRLTRHLLSEHDRRMRGTGAMAWPTAEVVPFSAWALSLWEEYGDAPALTGHRARALWERVVARDQGEGASWLAVGVARASFDAWRLMSEYSVELPADEIYLTEEASALKRWSASYESELSRLGFTGEAGLLAGVRRLILRGAPVAGEVILAGFDELSPAVASIVEALKGRQVAVSLWPAPGDEPVASEAVAVRCVDEEDEVRRGARWARALYRPGKRIGFIVPDLERYRRIITREFTAELDPGAVLPGEGANGVFNISLGAPLAEDPLAGSALDILSIGEGMEKAGLLRRALMSPYFAGPDLHGLAALDVRLRERNALCSSIATLRGLSTGGASRRLGDWSACLREQRKRLYPSAWARAFTTLLDRVGWLKGLGLTSAEFQGLKAWNGAIETLAGLDDVLGAVPRQEALGALSTIARETIHQVESREADIQVLGVLEAAGLWFDHVRVLGCHERALPAEPSPNPFIPLFLQRAKRLPHSTSERELEFSRVVARRLMSSAPSVVISWPLVSEDRELQGSPLFRGLALTEEGDMPSARLADMPLAALEEAPVDAPLPVGDAEKAALRGGTSILKNQSMCPFRAFAIHRLHARALPDTGLDLRPEARGSIIHSAMRFFWEEVRDSATLKRMHETGGLEAYARDIAARAMEEARVPEPLSSRFVELERQRLAALIMDWASVELRRETPFKVKRVELEKELVVGGLPVSGRVDRIDEIDGGGEAILDYKTGKTEIKDWLTGRPMDPQLLIYSIDSGCSAVSFARVVPGDCRFLGISRDVGLPGVKPYDEHRFKALAGGLDWDGLMAFWKGALEGLARDFLAGVNDVDPNNGPNDDRACKYCELPLLCRFRARCEDDDDEQ